MKPLLSGHPSRSRLDRDDLFGFRGFGDSTQSPGVSGVSGGFRGFPGQYTQPPYSVEPCWRSRAVAGPRPDLRLPERPADLQPVRPPPPPLFDTIASVTEAQLEDLLSAASDSKLHHVSRYLCQERSQRPRQNSCSVPFPMNGRRGLRRPVAYHGNHGAASGS